MFYIVFLPKLNSMVNSFIHQSSENYESIRMGKDYDLI